MVDEALTLPDLLRVSAQLIRIEHGPRCPDFAEWRRVAALLERVADDPDGPDRVRALKAAAEYLGADLVGVAT